MTTFEYNYFEATDIFKGIVESEVRVKLAQTLSLCVLAGRRSPVPRDFRLRYTCDVAYQDNRITFLYGDVITG